MLVDRAAFVRRARLDLNDARTSATCLLIGSTRASNVERGNAGCKRSYRRGLTYNMDTLTATAASGMRSRLESLDLLANNLANANTSGYKADQEAYQLYF